MMMATPPPDDDDHDLDSPNCLSTNVEFESTSSASFHFDLLSTQLVFDPLQHGSYHLSADGYTVLQVSEDDHPSLCCHHHHHHHHPPNPPPPPPPPPAKIKIPTFRHLQQTSALVPKETNHMWDNIFKQGQGADVHIVTYDGDNNLLIPAHSYVLSVASPVLETLLQQSKLKNGFRRINIPGVPHGAAWAFLRFIYSSCYEEDEMNKFVLHLLVLSHSYMVPPLKRVCIYILEQGWLSTENVVDVLQLARNCDAPRLSCICLRMIEKDFRAISSTEGWKTMKRSNPALEQELLEMVVEADSRKQERLKKIEERNVYLQLHEAMEALLHICRDGCRTIGPRDKFLKGNQVACSFPACKGIEILVRHFSGCKARVPGGCLQCKRMWQLLELHSRMCNEPEYCKVPLCRHFKEKIQQQSKKDETKWKLLVSKVKAAKYGLGPFSRSKVWNF